AEAELELHLHARAALRAEPAHRVFVAPHGLEPVDGPGDRFQDGRLARAVGSENPGNPRPELELGIGVLPEVGQMEAAQLHQLGSSRPACSTYSTPRRTNSAR